MCELSRCLLAVISSQHCCFKMIDMDVFFSCLGVELREFIPSLESLFDAEELKNVGLAENHQFRFVLKSGYEQIARASSLTS